MTSFEKGNKIKFKKPLGHMIWFKVFLTFLVFIPPYSQILYDPLQTPNVIAAVMEKPLVAYLAWILPIAKTALLMAIILPFIFDKLLHKFLLAYYAVILLIIAIMQNISFTEDYGFVWLMGNTLVQFVVVGFCLVDLLKNKTSIKREYLVKSRLWIVFFMFLAFLMPYSVTGEGYVYPSLTANIFYNESGVTYCMITPVIIGILLLFSKGVDKSTLSIISYVGFIFGLLNMMTWFFLQIDNWWMGVLHLPLVIISLYGLIISYKEKILV